VTTDVALALFTWIKLVCINTMLQPTISCSDPSPPTVRDLTQIPHHLSTSPSAQSPTQTVYTDRTNMVRVFWELQIDDSTWVEAEQDVKDIGVRRWKLYRRAWYVLFDVYEFYFTSTKGWRFVFDLAGDPNGPVGNDSFECFTFRPWDSDHCVDFDNGRTGGPVIDGVI